MQRKNLCSPLKSTLHVTLTYRTQVEKFTENTATHFSVFAIYFGNTCGWDFPKALICKHSLNHKSTCDQSASTMHSPTNTAILCFLRCVPLLLHGTCILYNTSSFLLFCICVVNSKISLINIEQDTENKSQWGGIVVRFALCRIQIGGSNPEPSLTGRL